MQRHDEVFWKETGGEKKSREENLRELVLVGRRILWRT
jgi:hypothetical protein